MKKFSIGFIAVIAMSFFLISWNQASKLEGAVHIGVDICGLIDGNGVTTITDGNVLITPSGNGYLKCQAKGVANSTGKAVHWDNENTNRLCNTTVGFTDDWRETVSASGNATLQCRVSN